MIRIDDEVITKVMKGDIPSGTWGVESTDMAGTTNLTYLAAQAYAGISDFAGRHQGQESTDSSKNTNG